MVVVIFEVWLAPEQKEQYLSLAATLRPLLAKIEGFIDIQRYQSLSEPHRLLSLSTWRDEAAVQAWRETWSHEQAQTVGREGLFEDYRIRVAAIGRDYGLRARSEAPLK